MSARMALGWFRASTSTLALVGVAVALCAPGCGDDDEPVPMDSGWDGGGGGGDSGGRDGGGADGGGVDGGPSLIRCGNGEIDPGETCDDTNRDPEDYCNGSCQISCGDGVVNMVETCDTAIASGATGACPADCDDSDACTSDILAGAECTLECMSAPITACTNGDGCCAPGCTALEDDDCTAMCGNMTLEPGETCDEGSVFDCPVGCDDRNTCTTDALAGGSATCDAMCMNDEVTACSATSDGCCPSSCTSATDADCSATCGNSILDAGETCEAGTAVPCPASCDDTNACTRNVRTGAAATCSVQCSFPPITACAAVSDGCCPAACNATNDGDCSPVCGNRVIEAGETCDDGNGTAGDGCDPTCQLESSATAFRLTDLDLADPHAFASVVVCLDVTSQLNTELQKAVTMDTDGDGLLDLSYLVVFRPLAQAAMRGTLDFLLADCTTGSTVCTRPAATTPLATAMYTNQTTGTCLDTTVGGASVVRPYSPAVQVPRAPCFVTDAQTITVTVSGITLTLYDAQVAATYVGTPATSTSNGLLRGFISETDAMATILPSTLPIVGGRTLASLLRSGGTSGCPTGTDIDTRMIGGTIQRGWWFFLNFPSRTVPYAEP